MNVKIEPYIAAPGIAEPDSGKLSIPQNRKYELLAHKRSSMEIFTIIGLSVFSLK